MIKQNAIVHLHMWKKGVYKHMNTFLQLSWSQSRRKGASALTANLKLPSSTSN